MTHQRDLWPLPETALDVTMVIELGEVVSRNEEEEDGLSTHEAQREKDIQQQAGRGKGKGEAEVYTGDSETEFQSPSVD